MKGKRHISKASTALVLAAVLLFAAGTVLAATDSPDILGNDYNAEIDMADVDIKLLENGGDPVMFESEPALGEVPEGKIQPGRVYNEKLQARNTGKYDAVVRMIVKTYWRNAGMRRDPKMDLELIELTYGNKAYNDAVWTLNDEETTAESKTYYLKKILGAGETSEPLVDRLRLNNKVLEEKNVKTEQKGNKTVYTYEYKYNSYILCLEADCQALQTHNANEAIVSAWGVCNVKLSDGMITVK